jgi:hypothetical protein
MTTPLRDHLLDQYGGYADQRIKDRSLDRPIRVDDWSSRDTYAYFCSIFVSVPDRTGDALVVTVHHAPYDDAVVSLVQGLGGTVVLSEEGATITLSLTTTESSTITSLSQAIRRLVGRGRHYKNPSWWWICRRTAESLNRLAASLRAYRSLRSSQRRTHDPRPPIRSLQSSAPQPAIAPNPVTVPVQATRPLAPNNSLPSANWTPRFSESPTVDT